MSNTIKNKIKNKTSDDFDPDYDRMCYPSPAVDIITDVKKKTPNSIPVGISGEVRASKLGASVMEPSSG